MALKTSARFVAFHFTVAELVKSFGYPQAAESLDDFRYEKADSLDDVRYEKAESLDDFRYEKAESLDDVRYEKSGTCFTSGL